MRFGSTTESTGKAHAKLLQNPILELQTRHVFWHQFVRCSPCCYALLLLSTLS